MINAFAKGSRPTVMLDYESEYLRIALNYQRKSFSIEMQKICLSCKIQDL